MEQSTSHIIMIRPARFGFNSQTAGTNVFQTKNGKDAQQLALVEFNRMVEQLTEAGVRVAVVNDTPNPPKPDAIFPNNWFSAHHDRTAIIYPMLAANRRLERRLDVIEDLRKDYQINRIIDLRDYENEGEFLEGTGSIVFDHKHKYAFACRSPRTNEKLFIALCEALEYQPICFDAFDRKGNPIYHTNVLVAIGTEWAVCCLESIPENQRIPVLNQLNINRELIIISQSQMAAFAGNILELQNTEGDKLIVLSETAYQHFSKQQRNTLEKYGRLLPVSIPTIEQVGGGSVRCMLAELFLKPLQ